MAAYSPATSMAQRVGPWGSEQPAQCTQGPWRGGEFPWSSFPHSEELRFEVLAFSMKKDDAIEVLSGCVI